MDFHFDMPWWLVAVLLAVYSIPLILSCTGVYYLVTKRFSRVSLTVAAAIFLALEATALASYGVGNFIWSSVSAMGSPSSVSAFIFGVQDLMTTIVYSILEMSVKFLTIFSVVNFIVRLRSRHSTRSSPASTVPDGETL